MKIKIMIILLTVALCVTSMTVFAQGAFQTDSRFFNPKYQAMLVSSYDINSDGKFNAADVLLVLRNSVGKFSLSESWIKRVDWNWNGRCDAEDALELLKVAVGKVILSTAD